VDVGGFMHQGRGSTLYLPSWTEIVISAGVVSAAVLVFLFFIERFKVWEERPVDPEADPKMLPEFNRVGSTWLGVPVVANRIVYSLAFIVAAAVGFALLSPQPAESRGVVPSPVHHARGGETLWIDGNLDGFGVAFQHEVHKSLSGGQCSTCHHMNLPLDRDTPCYQCHSDMNLPTDAFRHDWHRSAEGAGLSCVECHAAGEVRTADTAKDCGECHNDLFPANATIKVEQYDAVGYVSAMHQLCIGCHADLAQMTDTPEIARCAACHNGENYLAAQGLPERPRRREGKRLILPPY
jgi:hypothetical protein